MTPDLWIRVLLGFLPVVVFLGALIYLDSYKLVKLTTVLYTIAWGAVAAGLAFVVNVTLIDVGVSGTVVMRYAAPVVEEVLKGIAIVFLIRSKRVGFLVDAAIFGFAVGTGFAVVENIYYLHALDDSLIVVWIVRGFGTAIMHGGVTAIFAITSEALTERRGSESIVYFVPGMIGAIVIHSFFNHFVLKPVFSAVAVLVLLPPVIFLVFRRSEASLVRWLGVGLDADAELLQLMQSGEFSRSRIGNYLQSLKERFRGEVLADMLCYLRIHVELSIKAKGVLLMREAGFEAPPDRDVQDKFEELRYLERSMGKTGKLAITPFLHTSSRDLWQLYMLGK